VSSEEILASFTAHYTVTGQLTASQLQEHKRRGACPACERDELDTYVAEAMADPAFAQAYRRASRRRVRRFLLWLLPARRVHVRRDQD
jgi:hypothetical protein